MITSTPSTTGTKTFLFVAGILIVRLLYRVIVPGGEWPVSPVHYLSMLTDVVLLVVLILMKIKQPEGADPSLAEWKNRLFLPGVAAGIGLLLIRLTSDQSWWTGHLMDG